VTTVKANVRNITSALVVAAVKDVQSRQMSGVLIIDGAPKVRMANNASLDLLRPILGNDFSFSPNCEIPPSLQKVVEDIKRRLRGHQESCSVMLPSLDICVRACWLETDDHPHLLLIVERASRRDTVRAALAGYPLTAREAEVAALVLRGYSNKRIAHSLMLTEYTIEDHLKRIFAKVGVRTRTALASKILGVREEITG